SKPNALEPRYRLASLLVLSGKVHDAQAQVAKMREIAPGDLRTLYVDALASYASGDNAHARDQLQRVLSVVPAHLPSLFLSGLVSYRLGALSGAEEALRKVVSQAPNDVGARRALAATYLRSGRAADAQ